MPEAREHPPSTARIEAFSDGVIAIIITIMVLELKVPSTAFDRGDLVAVVNELGPGLLIYALSFLVVAIMTVNHHALMKVPPRATIALFWWNAYLLFWMSLVPLATAVFARHPLQPLSVAFYGAIIFLASIGFQRLRRCVSLIGRDDGVMPPRLRALYFKNVITTVFWGLSVPLAYVSVYISIAIFVLVPASYFIPDFNPLPQLKPHKSNPT